MHNLPLTNHNHRPAATERRPAYSLLRKEWGNAGETRLLRKECWIDFRRKWLSSACSDGERPILLRKEWGKAGKTRLLRKEFMIDLRRKWLSGVCSEGKRPVLLRKECGNAGETLLLRKECRIDFRRKWVRRGFLRPRGIFADSHNSLFSRCFLVKM